MCEEVGVSFATMTNEAENLWQNFTYCHNSQLFQNTFFSYFAITF